MNSPVSDYFIPPASKWPLFSSIAIFPMMLGAAAWLNGVVFGKILCLLGLVALLAVFFAWFRDTVRESEGGLYSPRIATSFRWSMSWFIFSEVLFFAAFSGALLYARVITFPLLGDLDHKVLWPDFMPLWGKTTGPANLVSPSQEVHAWGIPTLNTVLLLISGLTLTLSHHALRVNERAKTAFYLLITVLLGITFLGFQVYEYVHAYHALNLKLTSGIFGSLFFLLTGFHGFHVTLGVIMLSIILLRLLAGHFSAQNHFAFEAVAWYWHFVDIVWLLLYVFVYLI